MRRDLAWKTWFMEGAGEGLILWTRDHQPNAKESRGVQRAEKAGVLRAAGSGGDGAH